MTYCLGCGQFEPILYPQDLCGSCFILYSKNELNLKHVAASNRDIEKGLTKPLMSYLHELELFRGKNTPTQTYLQNLPPFHENAMNSETNTLYPRSLGQDPNFRLAQNNAGQYNYPRGSYGPYGYPGPITGNMLRKSNIALVLMILGLFMPVVVGLPLEIGAVALAVVARRTEPRNWRQIVVLVGALFIIAVLILALYLITTQPELFEGTDLIY